MKNSEWVVDKSRMLVEKLFEDEINKGTDFIYEGLALDADDCSGLFTPALIIYARHLADIIGLPLTTFDFVVNDQSAITDDNSVIAQPFTLTFNNETPMIFSVLAPLVVEVFEVDLLPYHHDLTLFFRNTATLSGVPIADQSNSQQMQFG